MEIGTRNGDVSKCVAQFTRRAFAVESDQRYCARLAQRKIEVECTRFEKVSDARLLDVEVYFWFVWPPNLSEGWLRRLWKLPRPSNMSTTVLVGFDGHVPEDMRYMPLLVAHYGGSVDRVFFDEGGDLTSGRHPSYSHPYMYRPGRWGVIHVAKFQLNGSEPTVLPAKMNGQVSRAIHANVTTGWTWAEQGWKAGTKPFSSSIWPAARTTSRRGG